MMSCLVRTYKVFCNHLPVIDNYSAIGYDQVCIWNITQCCMTNHSYSYCNAYKSGDGFDTFRMNICDMQHNAFHATPISANTLKLARVFVLIIFFALFCVYIRVMLHSAISMILKKAKHIT